jgi:hypothetical protein
MKNVINKYINPRHAFNPLTSRSELSIREKKHAMSNFNFEPWFSKKSHLVDEDVQTLKNMLGKLKAPPTSD